MTQLHDDVIFSNLQIELLQTDKRFFQTGAFGFGSDRDKILLKDIEVLTLRHGQMTTGRRSSPVPQVRLNFSAKCNLDGKFFYPYASSCRGDV